ncbi:MAG: hypothetical protein MUP82_09075, partial [Candidatus Marinimicrobia bacterium]|nr:hypothetical protein [Candidatus Neomarinimicrobiota bacterium]
RRLPYLVEHMRSLPFEWNSKNQATLRFNQTVRPHLLISNALMSNQNEIIDEIFTHIKNNELYLHYKLMKTDYLRWHIEVIHNLIITSVRTGNRLSLINYAHSLAVMRKKEGINSDEVCQVIMDIGDIVINKLILSSELKRFEVYIQDTISLSIQMMVDEISDTYDLS